MSTSTKKAEEAIFARDINDGNPATWVPLSQYREYVVLARSGEASPTDNVTIQLRKATNGSGSNAANQGSAVTAAGFVATSCRDDELGDFSAGVPYTHVSAVITDEVSPNEYSAVAYLQGARF